MPNYDADAKSAVSKLSSVARPEGDPELAPQLGMTIDELAGSSGSASGDAQRPLLVRGIEPFNRQPMRRTMALESIIGVTDDRTRIDATGDEPWRMICSLDIHARFGRYIGTGWFAGPRTLITAGHCVFDNQMGGWATEIHVYAGRNGQEKPFPMLVSRKYSTTDRWFAGADPDFDYGVIHLPPEAEAITAKTGWFGLMVKNDAGLRSQRVNISGYPADKGGDEQWFHAKQIVHVTDRRLYYDVDTTRGQSGAPVWLQTDNGPRVVGIHAYGTGASVPGVSANSAPRITQEVLDVVKGWVKG